MIEINFSILLVQILTFLAALFVVWKISWGPITKMMEKRTQDIKNDIETAKAERVAAEELRKSYETQIKESKVEARRIINEAMEAGSTERNKIVDAANAESKTIVLNAKRELAGEKERLKKELQKDVTELAVKISEKLILKTLDKATQDKIFKDTLDKIGDKDSMQ
jgi:F-type H+-transporting ATPase subunit b